MRKRYSNFWKYAGAALGVFIVFALVFGYIVLTREVETGDIGDLISGTLGVGAAIAGTIFLIATLKEQSNNTKQQEIHHLVSDFNNKFDEFQIFLEQDAVGFSGDVRSFLLTLWSQEEVEWSEKGQSRKLVGIDPIIAHFRSQKIDITTKQHVEKHIPELCRNEFFVKTAQRLKRLQLLLEQIEELRYVGYERIKNEWNTIDKQLKLSTAFYFVWKDVAGGNYNVNSIVNSFDQELINEYGKWIIPENIPFLILEILKGYYPLNETKFIQQEITFNAYRRAEIERMISIELNESDRSKKIDFKDDLNFKGLTKGEKISYTILELLGEKGANDIYTFLKPSRQSNLSSSKQKFDFDLKLKMESGGYEWEYVNTLRLVILEGKFEMFLVYT